MKPLMESTIGLIAGTGLGIAAKDSQAATSCASVLSGASAIGAFSVA